MNQLIFSSSSLSTSTRCRKKYYFGYELMREPVKKSDAADKGTRFHWFAEQFANAIKARDSKAWNAVVRKHADDEMLAVFQAWRKNRWALQPDQIVGAGEQALYVPLVKTGGVDVWLRCTFDLIYSAQGWYTGRDYKTFSRAPSMNADLNFQGRLYTAVGMKHFGTEKFRFEFECVRSAAPGSPRGEGNELIDGVWGKRNAKGVFKAAETWDANDCYFTIPLVCSPRESDIMWKDAQDMAADLVRARKEQRWYRVDQHGGGYDQCSSCFFAEMCRSDLIGSLDETRINELSEPRKPLVLPDEYYKRYGRRKPKKEVAA